MICNGYNHPKKRLKNGTWRNSVQQLWPLKKIIECPDLRLFNDPDGLWHLGLVDRVLRGSPLRSKWRSPENPGLLQYEKDLIWMIYKTHTYHTVPYHTVPYRTVPYLTYIFIYIYTHTYRVYLYYLRNTSLEKKNWRFSCWFWKSSFYP